MIFFNEKWLESRRFISLKTLKIKKLTLYKLENHQIQHSNIKILFLYRFFHLNYIYFSIEFFNRYLSLNKGEITIF